MVTGENDYRVFKLPRCFKVIDEALELIVDLLDQPDAQIIIGEQIVNDAFGAYRTILLAAAGLASDFVLPRHGTPSGSDHGDAW